MDELEKLTNLINSETFAALPDDAKSSILSKRRDLAVEKINEVIENEVKPLLLKYGVNETFVVTLHDEAAAAPAEDAEAPVLASAAVPAGYHRRYTPRRIERLAPDEVFVYGSNIYGRNGGGAARQAQEHFGARGGVGEGPNGQCYAIPTMEGGVDYIRGKVNTFLDYARQHREKTFLVTRIGCGIAHFTDAQIGPLFAEAIPFENVILPQSFVDVIEGNE